MTIGDDGVADHEADGGEDGGESVDVGGAERHRTEHDLSEV